MKFFQGNHLAGRQLFFVNAAIASDTYAVSDVKILSCSDDVLISNHTIIVPYGKEISIFHLCRLNLLIFSNSLFMEEKPEDCN